MFNQISIYNIALFLHIVGALGVFAALALEWAARLALREATTGEQVRDWLKLFAWMGRLYPVSSLAILLPGFYMTLTTWGGTAWILTALAGVLAMGVIGGALTRQRMRSAAGAAASQSGRLPAELRQQLNDPLLWASLRVRLAIGLGIVFLMSAKPGLAGSLAVMLVAVLLGLAFSLSTRGRGREGAPAQQVADRL